MRWWMVRHAEAMGVDNTSLVDMDYSTLPADISIVEWTNGQGEIQRFGQSALRDNFTDITPYLPFFRQFMGLLENLTLHQARKLQSDIINELYDAKRQAPYTYQVSAGNFSWDTADGTMANLAIAAIPVVMTALGMVIGQQGDTQGSLVTQINSRIAVPGEQLRVHLNTAVIGTTVGTDTINGRLVGATANPFAFMVPLAANPFSEIEVPSPGQIGATLQWTPIGQPNPITLSTTDMIGLMSSIAGRRTNLLTVKVNKTAAVNALTNVTDVINYDAGAGW
jgi:hypothetical protein